MDSNQSPGKCIKHKKKLFYGEEGQALDQVPQRLWRLHSWRYSNLIIHSNEKLLWLTVLEQGVGLDGLKRSLMFPANAWLCGPAPPSVPQLLLAM